MADGHDRERERTNENVRTDGRVDRPGLRSRSRRRIEVTDQVG